MNEQQIEAIIEQHCNQSSREAHHNAAKQIWETINAQQQPAAPLSSLPEEWKEKIQQAGGVYANTKNEFKFFNKGAEWLLPELLALQAENQRLKIELDMTMQNLTMQNEWYTTLQQEHTDLRQYTNTLFKTLQETQAENTRLREQLQAAQPPAAGEAVAFGKVFEWLHEWGLKPSGNIRYAGQWQDGVGNYYTVEQLKEFFDRDTQTKGGI